MYYMSVTAHGTLMALVFTTFFIMGFGYVVAEHALGAALAMRRTAWVSFWIAVAGHAGGRRGHPAPAKPPSSTRSIRRCKAHPAFYIGLTLLVVGSWGWALVMLCALGSWRRANPGRPIPLVGVRLSPRRSSSGCWPPLASRRRCSFS